MNDPETYTIAEMKRLISPSHTGTWAKVLVLVGDRIYQRRDDGLFHRLDNRVHASVNGLVADDGS